MGDVQIAIDTYKQGPILKRKLDDALLELHFALGGALEKNGDMRSALKEYSRVGATNINFKDVAERLKRLTAESSNPADGSPSGIDAEG